MLVPGLLMLLQVQQVELQPATEWVAVAFELRRGRCWLLEVHDFAECGPATVVAGVTVPAVAVATESSVAVATGLSRFVVATVLARILL